MLKLVSRRLRAFTGDAYPAELVAVLYIFFATVDFTIEFINHYRVGLEKKVQGVVFMITRILDIALVAAGTSWVRL